MDINDLSNMDLSNYKGEWVVIKDKKVIAHAKKLTELKDFINNYGGVPLVYRVPKHYGYYRI